MLTLEELGTQDVRSFQVTVDGKSVFLYDTPGFDDTDGNDAEIFEMISKYLAASYSNNQRLNGVIFMQPVGETRVPDSERKRTQLFKLIVGEDNFNQVVIASSMWDQVNMAFGERNEKNRTGDDEVWGDMMEKGAKVIRFQNNEQSALQIVRHFLAFPKITMLLQKELKDKNGRLNETSACQLLEAFLGARLKDIELQIGVVGATARLRESMEKLKGLMSRLKKLVIKGAKGAWPIVTGGAKAGLVILEVSQLCQVM
ncbi:unnamed protein product [Discula destructiva]